MGTFSWPRTLPYAGESGLGFLVQGAANLTQVVTTHSAVPAMLGRQVRSARPVHFVAHAGRVALHNDGDGSVSVVKEAHLSRAASATRRYDSGRAHHGVAVPLDDMLLLSVPNAADEADSLPVGVRAISYAGEPLDEALDCPSLHGEASRGDLVAFGCRDGVLVAEGHDDHLDVTKIANPEGTAPGVRVGTVRSHPGVPFFLGNFGPQQLVRIDPVAGAMRPLDVPGTVRSFWLTAQDGGTAIVLTTDGKVHKLNPSTGALRRSTQVVPEFGTSGTRPTMAVGGRTAYVTDPRAGTLSVVSLQPLLLRRTVTLGGAPSAVAVVTAGG